MKIMILLIQLVLITHWKLLLKDGKVNDIQEQLDSTVDWVGEWQYDINGNPTPIVNMDSEISGLYGLSHIVIKSNGSPDIRYDFGEYY